MSAVFVALIFGYCAGIEVGVQEPTLDFGYMADGKCQPQLQLTGTNKTEPQTMPGEHSILWEWLDGGAEITIDEQKFVVMGFREA